MPSLLRALPLAYLLEIMRLGTDSQRVHPGVDTNGAYCNGCSGIIFLDRIEKVPDELQAKVSQQIRTRKGLKTEG